MSAMKNKLKDQRGVSVVIALLFFLFCAVIGSIILASAASNAGRLSHMEQEQQAYLTTSSAATMIQQSVNGMKFKAVAENGVEKSMTLPAGDWSSYIGLLAEKVYADDTEQTATFEIAATDMEVISGKMTMDTDYNVSVVLNQKNNPEQYKMTIKISAEAKKNEVSHRRERGPDDAYGNPTYREIEILTTTAKWGIGEVEKGDGTL